jgi:hypothetical protein
MYRDALRLALALIIISAAGIILGLILSAYALDVLHHIIPLR